MASDVKNSINLLSHIHSQSSDFLQKKLAEKGFENFASSHGNILFQLSRTENLRMNELSRIINRDKSTTTVLVPRLEKEGLVKTEPSSEDKRIRIEKPVLSKKIKKHFLRHFLKSLCIKDLIATNH